jgi:hypothetical protein
MLGKKLQGRVVALARGNKENTISHHECIFDCLLGVSMSFFFIVVYIILVSTFLYHKC